MSSVFSDFSHAAVIAPALYELKSLKLLGVAFLAAAVSLVSFNFLQQLIIEASIKDGFQVSHSSHRNDSYVQLTHTKHRVTSPSWAS